MLKIEATKSSPFVYIDVHNCIFEISGLSYANNTDVFYKQIINYIDREFSKLECELNCKFYLTVFNSVTYKYILNMMAKFMMLNKKGKNISVTWYYDKDDEDNLESAEDIGELFNIPFILKEYNNPKKL